MAADVSLCPSENLTVVLGCVTTPFRESPSKDPRRNGFVAAQDSFNEIMIPRMRGGKDNDERDAPAKKVEKQEKAAEREDKRTRQTEETDGNEQKPAKESKVSIEVGLRPIYALRRGSPRQSAHSGG